MAAKQWTIEEGKGGVFFVVDQNGTRLCRLYGLRQTKLDLAEIICSIPALVEALDKKKQQWKILAIEEQGNVNSNHR